MNKMQKISTRKNLRLHTPCRNQVSMDLFCLDDLIPEGHRARKVWAFVERLEVNRLYDRIRSVPGGTGRAATCPKVLLALWIYALLDQVTSGRKIVELVQHHNAYRWIAGGTGVNRDNINSFRAQGSEVFDDLLTECIAGMLRAELIQPEDLAHDGTRVVAQAGKQTYRRENTLRDFLGVSKLYLQDLLNENRGEAIARSARQKAAQLRGAKEQVERIQQALDEIECQRETRDENNKKNRKRPLTKKQREDVRASYSDPNARKMLMPDGSWKIAYNIQFATGVKSKVIYGVEATSNGNDAGQLLGMMLQTSQRLEKLGAKDFIRGWTADSGYSSARDIRDAAAMFPRIPLAIAPKYKKTQEAPHVPRKKDSPAIREWRLFLLTDEYEKLYAGRCESAEFSNMITKAKGMGKMIVKGLRKVHNQCILFALAHNLLRIWNLESSLG